MSEQVYDHAGGPGRASEGSRTAPYRSHDPVESRARSGSRESRPAVEEETTQHHGESTRHGLAIPPDGFPGYTLIESLGEGEMGVVYKARQRGLNRLVALKMILGGRRAGSKELIRFLAEAEAVASIRHPNVVQVHEYGEVDGQPFLAMECLTGGSLADRLRGGRRLEPAEAADLLARIALGVQAAHDQGIVHRDLKPANILFGDDGEPKVTDFGLAKQSRGVEVTRTHEVMGTPAYMSPEQAQGWTKYVGPSADVYALGVILYECLAGVRPFDSTDPVPLLSRVVAEAPKSPRHHVPGLSRDLELIVLKCLSKAPIDRYSSAEALSADLRRSLAGQPIQARATSLSRRAWLWCRRNPLPAALAATLLASALVGWSWSKADHERAEKAKIADYLALTLVAPSAEDNPRGSQLTVRELLDRVGSRIGGDFRENPEIEASIRETVGKAYLSLGEYEKAEVQLQAARELATGLRGPGDRTSLRIANLLALLLEKSGRRGQAIASTRENLDASRSSLGAEDPTTLEASARLGSLLRAAGDLDEAEPLLRSTLEARRRVLPAEHPDIIGSVHELSLLEAARSRYGPALALAEEFERAVRCSRGLKHPDNVTALAHLGRIHRLLGRPDRAAPFYDRAEEAGRQILGEQHPTTLAVIAEHARVMQDAASSNANRPRKVPPARP